MRVRLHDGTETDIDPDVLTGTTTHAGGQTWVATRPLDFNVGHGGAVFTDGSLEPVNPCEHCGRATWVPAMADSIGDAWRRGWLLLVVDPP